MGLRERKRSRLREELIAAAVSLFRERGFAATTVREILTRVDASEATFFNYFSTKEAVLYAWAGEVVAAALAAEGGPAATRSGARQSLRRMAEALEADRPLAREAWLRLRVGAAERAAPWLPVVREGQARGEVRSDLPAEEMARILAAALDAAVATWAEAELARDAHEEPLARRLQRAADLVLDGCRKRHERVRAPADARAAQAASGPPPPSHRV